MKDTTVASRYAVALLLVTERRGETAQALEDLKLVLEVVRPGTPIARHLAAPQLRLADKRQAIQRSLEGKSLRVVALFLDLLLRKKRLAELPTIVSEFEALVEKSQGLQRAHLVSAVPLTPTETDRLLRELEAFTRGKIRLTSEVDPELLGGALVRIGDRVIDRSVATLLETISLQLAEVSV